MILAFSHCSTIVTIAYVDEVNVYSGTRQNLELVNGGLSPGHPHQPIPQSCLFTGGLIDLPFSLILDTVALPYTIPASIFESEDENPD